GGITGVLAYDSIHEQFAAKARLDVNATEQLSLWVMAGYGEDDDYNFYKPWEGEWAVWGGAGYQLNEKTSLNLQVGYDDGENLGIAANVAHELVPGFTVTAEVGYLDDSVDDALGGFIRFQRDF